MLALVVAAALRLRFLPLLSLSATAAGIVDDDDGDGNAMFSSVSPGSEVSDSINRINLRQDNIM